MGRPRVYSWNRYEIHRGQNEKDTNKSPSVRCMVSPELSGVQGNRDKTSADNIDHVPYTTNKKITQVTYVCRMCDRKIISGEYCDDCGKRIMEYRRSRT